MLHVGFRILIIVGCRSSVVYCRLLMVDCWL